MSTFRRLFGSSTFWAGALGVAAQALSAGLLDWRVVSAAVLAYGLRSAAEKLGAR